MVGQLRESTFWSPTEKVSVAANEPTDYGADFLKLCYLLFFREDNFSGGDVDDDIIFEDFARLRLKAGESEA